jgi:hypothetical protein
MNQAPIPPSQEELDQPKGSFFPRFHSPGGFYFSGPLFRVITNSGEDEPTEPLPRLLVNFFAEFGSANRLFREKSIVFWARNRRLVKGIAHKYVLQRTTAAEEDGIEYGRRHCYPVDWEANRELQEIVLHCHCCPFEDSCDLCEFNQHTLAFLWRAERHRIVAHQFAIHQWRKYTNVEPESDIISHIAGYATGPNELGDDIYRLARNSRALLTFIQNSCFALEIRSIITRDQFNSWHNAFEDGRLRPILDRGYISEAGLLGGRSFAAYLLRRSPNLLDTGFLVTIPYIARSPRWIGFESYYAPSRPSDEAVLLNRQHNSDFWVNTQGDSGFIHYERHGFAYTGVVPQDLEDLGY